MSTSKNPHRRLLSVSVAAICKEEGFNGASKVVLESLTELLQAYLTELTLSTRKFCEHGHRTTPDLTDIKMALAEVGTSVHALHIYSRRKRSQPFRSLTATKPPVEHKTFKTGISKINQPSYIPNNFPEYPEVHSFVRTPALREPVNQYEIVRERIAAQMIGTENALVKYYSRTSPSIAHVFTNIDTTLYPFCSVTREPYPYLKALLTDNRDEGDTDELSSPEKQVKDTVEESTSVESSQNTCQSLNTSISDSQYLREAKRVKLKR